MDASSALSPRPELSTSSLRRRAAVTSPRVGTTTEGPFADPPNSYTADALTPRVSQLAGPHRNDDILSPDLHNDTAVPSINLLSRRDGPTQSYYVFPATPKPAHTFPPASSPPLPPLPPPSPPPTIVSAPSSHSLATNGSLKRLPTPDFTNLKARPYVQAITAPLSFLRRGPSVDEGEEAPRRWPWGRGAAHPPPLRRPALSSSNSGVSEGSQYSTSKNLSDSPEKLLPKLPGQRTYWLKKGGHRDGEMEDEFDDETPLMRRGTRPNAFDGAGPLAPPESRHPTVTSPNPNAYAPDALAALLPALQATSARFTRRFPVSSGRTRGAAHPGVDLGIESLHEWTAFKWVLILSVLSVLAAGLWTFALAAYTWLGGWPQAPIVSSVEYNILVFATLASASLILAGLFGISGALLNSRPILAFYCLLLWPAFISILTVGYTAYKRRTFNLNGKLSQGWMDFWGDEGREVIQNNLLCCGFYNPQHDYAMTSTCYPRSQLPGCVTPLTSFEDAFLRSVYTAVFGTVPLHIFNIVAALLCANHINRTFGRGMTPKPYRLSIADVKANAEKIRQTLEEEKVKVPYEPRRYESYPEKRVKSFADEGAGAGEDEFVIDELEYYHGS